MIHLRLVRKPTTPSYTEGDLYVNGEWWAYTLEDTVRTGKKVFSQTAIPAGKYQLTVDFSPEFKREMTHILNVPGFEGVRVHQGLDPSQTKGCPLISKARGQTPGHLAAMVKGQLTDQLTALVKAAGGGDIEIVNG